MAKDNNQNARKYGGERAIRRISEGKPFIGLAKDEQTAVDIELQAKGIEEIVKSDAIRLQSALNLYWNAVQKAAADGDLNAFDRYISRYGWLAGVTLRAWAQVKQDQKQNKNRITEVLDAYSKEGSQDTPTCPQNDTGESE
jgi:hypothetical protein